jgi:hypothetical protein
MIGSSLNVQPQLLKRNAHKSAQIRHYVPQQIGCCDEQEKTTNIFESALIVRGHLRLLLHAFLDLASSKRGTFWQLRNAIESLIKRNQIEKSFNHCHSESDQFHTFAHPPIPRHPATSICKCN